ncbi:hypothetical protein [Pseudarthrobacter sp. NS4]|uniref:hypothetical protein n=1 Tax=Pseudarthrobacter sp. NS4 TaxID=2973976 RepID=UPI00216370C7|nr:hypothetical protein [Pseudarthrobacter sp. NS4]
MVIPEDVLTATQSRFQARRGPRAGTEEKIAEAHTAQGSILNVDAPERLELRTRRVLRQPVVVDALRATEDTSPAIRGKDLDDPVPERIISGNNLLGIAFLELDMTVSRSVGRVIVRDRFQIRSFGTGFMISPRLGPDKQPCPARRSVRPFLATGIQLPKRSQRPSPRHVAV